MSQPMGGGFPITKALDSSCKEVLCFGEVATAGPSRARATRRAPPPV